MQHDGVRKNCLRSRYGIAQIAPLLLYVAASPHAVSAALVQEQDREGTTRQCPVYYVSEVLTTSKCNMTELEKIAYAVVMA